MPVDTTNANAVAAVSVNINRGVTCIWSVYPKGQQHGEALLIAALSVNTLARLKAYETDNATRNSAVIPRLSGNNCN